jgi:hydroxyethylthiazole kinase-like uncharacterized protein yjeF
VRVLDSSSMKNAEEEAAARGVSRLLMMESAGRALAEVVCSLVDASLKPSVLVVAGTGNNGGDGAAAARHLDRRTSVTLILLGGHAKVRAEEAALQWKIISAVDGIRVIEASTSDDLYSLKPLFDSSHVIVDAIFGTGVKDRVGEPQATAIGMINSSKALKVAVDIPSGLDPDTGEDHGLVVRADVTVALHAAKPGLLKRPDVVGRLVVEEIGMP